MTKACKQLSEPCEAMREITGDLRGPDDLIDMRQSMTSEEYGALIREPAVDAAQQLQATVAADLTAVQRKEIGTDEAVRTGRAAAAALQKLACSSCVLRGECPVQEQLETSRKLGTLVLQDERRKQEKAVAAQAEIASSLLAKPSYATNAELAVVPPEIKRLFQECRTRVLEFRIDENNLSAVSANRMPAPDSPAYWSVVGSAARKRTRSLQESESATDAEVAQAQLEELSCLITHAMYVSEVLRMNDGKHSQPLGEVQQMKQHMSHAMGLMQAVGEYFDLNAVALAHHLENIVNITVAKPAVKQRSSGYIWQMLRGAMAESAFGQLLDGLYQQGELKDYYHSTPQEDVCEGYDFAAVMPNGEMLKLDVKASRTAVGNIHGYKVSLDDRSAGKVTIESPVRIEEMGGWFRLEERTIRERTGKLRQVLKNAHREVQAMAPTARMV